MDRESLADLPAASRREVVAGVCAVLDVEAATAEDLVRSAEPLWSAMERAGELVNSWGRGQVLPPLSARLGIHSVGCGRRLTAAVAGVCKERGRVAENRCRMCGRLADAHDRHVRFRLPEPVLASPDREKTAGAWLSHGTAESWWMMQIPSVGAFVRALLSDQAGRRPYGDLRGVQGIHPAELSACSASGGNRNTRTCVWKACWRTRLRHGGCWPLRWVCWSATPSTPRTARAVQIRSLHRFSTMSGPTRRFSTACHKNSADRYHPTRCRRHECTRGSADTGV